MYKFRLNQCPCIRLYNDKGTCNNGFHQCDSSVNCPIKQIVKKAMDNIEDCHKCITKQCKHCKKYSVLMFSKQIVDLLEPEFIKKANGELVSSSDIKSLT